VGLVTLTVVHNEAEAEVLSGMLRSNGIECVYRRTDVSAGALESATAGAGPMEVLVDERDAGAARELLPAS
jgi:hypothetical protein